MSKEIKGIDISRYQGTINFKKVKEGGYSFVIIRAGYGRLSSQKDSKFEEYYKGATEAGLEVGAYWYSYAKSASEGIEEAKACLEALKGKKFSYPVYYDVEERSQLNLGTSILTPMVNNFCKTIQDAGYVAGLYTFYSAISSFNINKIPYEKWLAKWGTSMGNCRKDEWCLWQHGIIGSSSEATISGKVPGCDNCSAVDVDVAFKDYTKITGISFANKTSINESTKPSTSKPSNSTSSSSSTNKTLKAGTVINCSNTPFYSASSSSSAFGKKTGKFYIYSSEVINGKIRVTNAASNVGKTPVGNYVTGWVKVSDITKKTSSSSSSSSSSSKIKAGQKIDLNNVNLYSSATSNNVSNRLTGAYYIYSTSKSNNRIRITNSASNVGKTPVGNYVTGWIKVSDIK